MTHKGVFYFDTYQAARTFAESYDLPSTRIIAYSLGWAIQREKSGPYFGPQGWK
jgi:hypothetical protein